MNIMAQWKVTYRKFDGSIEEYCTNSKTKAVRFYLNEMGSSIESRRSEYRIWKNDKDYTPTLNRFLSR